MVSIALCTYNGEKYLKEQLDSILNQTTKADEIIVCDDYSTDGTKAILETYKERFPGLFKIFYNASNLGFYQNFEKAVSLCTGEYIFLSDQDDVWSHNKIEVFIDYFRKNSNVHVVCCNCELVDENLNSTNRTIWDKYLKNKGDTIFNKDFIFHNQIKKSFAPGMGMALRKSFFTKTSPFPDFYQYDNVFFHDSWIATIASLNMSFGCIDKVLVKYRRHNEQVTSDRFYKSSLVGVNLLENILKRHLQKINCLISFMHKKDYQDKNTLLLLYDKKKLIDRLLLNPKSKLDRLLICSPRLYSVKVIEFNTIRKFIGNSRLYIKYGFGNEQL